MAAARGGKHPYVYGAAVRLLLRWVLARLRAGDPRPVLALFADDALHRFPGDSSWAGERGKGEFAAWLRRYVAVGLQLHPYDILVDGPPWRTRVAFTFEDSARSPAGEVVYRNRGVIYGRLRWGRIQYLESFEDTQKTAEFDDYLAATDRSGAPLRSAAR